MNKSVLFELKKTSHHLKPSVYIGHQGINESVLNEIDRTLHAHEFIKVKIHGWTKTEKQHIIATVCQTLQAVLIQTIGNVFTIYRKNDSKQQQH